MTVLWIPPFYRVTVMGPHIFTHLWRCGLCGSTKDLKEKRLLGVKMWFCKKCKP